MNIFNRREVFITYSAEDLHQIEDCLLTNNISYRVKRNSLLHPGKAINPGINIGAQDEYRVYVHKDDYECAKCVIAK